MDDVFTATEDFGTLTDRTNYEGNPKISCWDCKYNDSSGIAFFGRCTWFERHGKGKNKDIPREKVDEGCKFFEPMR